MKEQSLAILKYCLGYEDELLSNKVKEYDETIGGFEKEIDETTDTDDTNLEIIYYALKDLLKVIKDDTTLKQETKDEFEDKVNELLKEIENKIELNSTISVTKNPPEENEKYKEPSMAILKYCLSMPSVLGNSSISPSTLGNVVTTTGLDDVQELILKKLKNVQFQREQRKVAAYSILKYCLEEAPQSAESENLSEIPPTKDDKVESEITQEIKQVLSDFTKENPVEEETDKYKEPSLAVLKYCLNYEDENVEPDLPSTEEKQVDEETPDKYKEPSLAVLKYCLDYEDELRRKLADSLPPPPNQNLFPPLPPPFTKEEPKEEPKAEPEKVIESQIQTAGFSMLKYCLNFVKEQRELLRKRELKKIKERKELLQQENKFQEKKYETIIADKKLEKEQEEQKAKASNELKRRLQEKSDSRPSTATSSPSQADDLSNTSSTVSSEDTPSTTNTLKPTKLPGIISEYDKKLLAAIGLKFYLQFKDEDDLSSTGNSTGSLGDTENISYPSSRAQSPVNQDTDFNIKRNQDTKDALRNNAQQAYKKFKQPLSAINPNLQLKRALEKKQKKQ